MKTALMDRRPGGKGETGTTLVELMIAFMLLSVLCVAIVSVSGQMVADSTNADQRTVVYSDAQVVMDTITRQIQAATAACGAVTGSTTCNTTLEPIAYAGPKEITFYSSLTSDESGTGPTKFDITLSGGNLVETTWPADAGSGGVGWTYPAAGGAQTLAADVDGSHGSLFAYYTSSENAVTTPGTSLTDSPALVQSGGTSSTGTGNIEAVRIDLWTDPAGSGAGPSVEVTTVVHLLNYDYTNGIN
jgi:Tfp pilus assembly protein PilW